MSRYEKIINMPIDEMANTLASMCASSTCSDCPFISDCPASEAEHDWKEWLESEDKE